MYTMVLSSFADTERLADQKKEAIALLSQALKILDSLGPSNLPGQQLRFSHQHVLFGLPYQSKFDLSREHLPP